jgi:two-component system chemotaxis response regulator CheY
MEGKLDYNLKVLVVEDFGTMRRIICTALQEMGFNQVLEAEDGRAALQLLHREPVGLVITDWHMPNLGGLELVKEIRADPLTAALPVIMVTGDDEKDCLIAAAKARVNSYVIKPFTSKMLLKTIEMVLHKCHIPPA